VQRCYATRTSERDRQIAQLEADVADSRNKTKIKILKQLKKAEAIKQMFQKLQFLRNKHSRSGISRIEVHQNAQTTTENMQQVENHQYPYRNSSPFPASEPQALRTSPRISVHGISID
jgi:single-stranded DNA-specific DHH superfamily exonuclease